MDFIGLLGKGLSAIGGGSEMAGGVDMFQMILLFTLMRGQREAAKVNHQIADRSSDENAQRTIQIVCLGDTVDAVKEKIKSITQGGKCNGST